MLLDEKGKIAGVWVKVSSKDTVPKALEALEGNPKVAAAITRLARDPWVYAQVPARR